MTLNDVRSSPNLADSRDEASELVNIDDIGSRAEASELVNIDDIGSRDEASELAETLCSDVVNIYYTRIWWPKFYLIVLSKIIGGTMILLTRDI